MAGWVRAHAEGCAIAVRVSPRSARPGFTVDPQAVLIRVQAPATEGRATREAARTLARALGRPPSAVTLLSGPRSRSKVFRVAGVTPEEARRRLQEGP